MPADSVLVVDDTSVGRKLTRLLLAREGYDVRTAGSAEEALSALNEFQPKLILTDLQLPGIDGLEMIRRIKANPQTKDITIVALSARALMGDEVEARAAGCDGYFTKPVDTNKLPSQIRTVLSQRRAPMAEIPPPPFPNRNRGWASLIASWTGFGASSWTKGMNAAVSCSPRWAAASTLGMQPGRCTSGWAPRACSGLARSPKWRGTWNRRLKHSLCSFRRPASYSPIWH